MLVRVLEPEIMESAEEACDYDTMDHSAVNRSFVDDLLSSCGGDRPLDLGDVLDLGTGTALIPVELQRRNVACRILAADASRSMLDIARYNIEAAGADERIQLAFVDAKQLGYADGMFDTVISNSLLHHVPEPERVLREIIRVTKPGGMIFVRDLLRPTSEQILAKLVEQYAGESTAAQRKMFAESLHAALTVEEMQSLIDANQLAQSHVRATSDRHWTWQARR